MIRFYWYKGCSTCRRARKALEEAGVDFEPIDITEKPPPLRELKSWVKSGSLELKQLLNTSGQEYRRLKVSELLKTQPPAEILKLLSKNGRLLKRPILTDGKRVTAGFRDPEAVIATWS